VDWNDSLSQEFENLFLLLKTRIILSSYWVITLRKVWQSYIFEFDKSTSVDKIRWFLGTFDKWQDFILVTVHKIKTEARIYKDDLSFLRFLTKSF
jgi:hypothetical protein